MNQDWRGWYPDWVNKLKSGREALKRINFARQKNLRRLNLSGLLMDYVPEEIRNIKNLQELDFSGNTLTFSFR